MILWRPTNNNQRYAFTPLLDNPEDEDDDGEFHKQKILINNFIKSDLIKLKFIVKICGQI